MILPMQAILSKGNNVVLSGKKQFNDISYIVDGGDIPDIDDTLEVKRRRFKQEKNNSMASFIVDYGDTPIVGDTLEVK